jgi:hypothetical protein
VPEPPDTGPRVEPPSLAVIGAGPRGTGFLERLAANVPALYGSRRLDIHLVDPFPPGGGRTWRRDQPPLLWMNSVAADTTMFTDDTVNMAGPARPGPTLHQWAREVREGRTQLPDAVRCSESADEARVLRAELAALTGQTFASRRVQSAYLSWMYEQTVAAMPPGVRVHLHPTSALRLSGPKEGRQSIRLADRSAPLRADLVVLALGHLEGQPDSEQAHLREFAEAEGLLYVPPDFTADTDLSALPAGEPVIARGFGLAFIDLMALLTEGRGGRFTGTARGDDEGELVYRPSGREPVLYVGSRRGLPYHPKVTYDLAGQWPPLPRFLGPAQAEELLRRPQPPDHWRDVRPLIGKELGYAHYHRLFTRHPERTRLPWAAFERRYAAAEHDGPAMDQLISAAVPDPADRFDLDAVDRPLHRLRLPSADALQERIRACIRADLKRTHLPSESPDVPVYIGLLSLAQQLLRLGRAGDPDGRWLGLLSSFACGPPPPRLRQLLALSRAGIVRFLGPETTVEADERHGTFRAASPSVPGSYVSALTLVEARLPNPAPERVRHPLLRALYAEGAATASGSGRVEVTPGDCRVLERDGGAHPRRFALGPFTTAPTSAFARPRTGGAAFRQNDTAARAALTLLAALPSGSAPPPGPDRGSTSAFTQRVDARTP